MPRTIFTLQQKGPVVWGRGLRQLLLQSGRSPWDGVRMTKLAQRTLSPKFAFPMVHLHRAYRLHHSDHVEFAPPSMPPGLPERTRILLKVTSPGRSRFKKHCRRRAKLLGTNHICGNPFDVDNVPSQCMRCDRGQHRPCDRLLHCRAKYRSPNGVNKREILRAAARIQRQEQKAAGARGPCHPFPSHTLLIP